MSRVVQIDGYLGPVLGGLGEHVSQRTAGSYVAARYGSSQMRQSLYTAMQKCVAPMTTDALTHTEVPRSGSMFPWPVEMRVCGGKGGVPCNDGNPVSALRGLNGLGDVSNWACTSWARVMTQLEGLLSKAETMGLTNTPEYTAAREYFNSTTGAFDKPLLHCAEHTQSATMFYNALNARTGSSSPPPLTDAQGLLPNSDTVNSIVKWGAIGLVAIAGAYALGPIFRGLGGLIPKGKGR